MYLCLCPETVQNCVVCMFLKMYTNILCASHQLALVLQHAFQVYAHGCMSRRLVHFCAFSPGPGCPSSGSSRGLAQGPFVSTISASHPVLLLFTTLTEVTGWGQGPVGTRCSGPRISLHRENLTPPWSGCVWWGGGRTHECTPVCVFL